MACAHKKRKFFFKCLYYLWPVTSCPRVSRAQEARKVAAETEAAAAAEVSEGRSGIIGVQQHLVLHVWLAGGGGRNMEGSAECACAGGGSGAEEGGRED